MYSQYEYRKLHYYKSACELSKTALSIEPNITDIYLFLDLETLFWIRLLAIESGSGVDYVQNLQYNDDDLDFEVSIIHSRKKEGLTHIISELPFKWQNLTIERLY
jgi:hypothetical protein